MTSAHTGWPLNGLATLLFVLALAAFAASFALWRQMKRGKGTQGHGRRWRETRHIMIEDEPQDPLPDGREDT